MNGWIDWTGSRNPTVLPSWVHWELSSLRDYLEGKKQGSIDRLTTDLCGGFEWDWLEGLEGKALLEEMSGGNLFAIKLAWRSDGRVSH